MDRIQVTTLNCRAKFEDWIKNRGGVRVWRNTGLPNNGGGDVFTPANDLDGGRYPKPNWSLACGETVITDIKQFMFIKNWTEIKRFRVALRKGVKGRLFKCTDASPAKISKYCEKFPGSSYRFDFTTKEAVIEVPEWEHEL